MTSPLPAGECASLIVLTGSLGDVARGLPMAAALKAARPRGHVSWVVERRWAPLVGLSRHVDRLVVFDRAAGMAGVRQLVRDLRARPYDIAFDLQRIFKSGVIAWLSRARRRVGFNPRETKEGNQFFNTEFIPEMGRSVSKLRHYLAFAEHVGVEAGAAIDFGLRRDALAAHLPAPLRARAYVAVVVGTSWPSKDWPARHWQRLCELVVSATSLDVVLVGARDASDPGGAAAVRQARLVDLRGRTSIEELAAVLAGARLAVGPDTGPGHVAAAVGTAYAGVFGPTDPARVAPWGCEGLAVRSPVTCDRCPRRRCRRGDQGCMHAITAEQVWARVERTLKS
jgi:ADP-heptose:LPS heptosyltransferase